MSKPASREDCTEVGLVIPPHVFDALVDAAEERLVRRNEQQQVPAGQQPPVGARERLFLLGNVLEDVEADDRVELSRLVGCEQMRRRRARSAAGSWRRVAGERRRAPGRARAR